MWNDWCSVGWQVEVPNEKPPMTAANGRSRETLERERGTDPGARAFERWLAWQRQMPAGHRTRSPLLRSHWLKLTTLIPVWHRLMLASASSRRTRGEHSTSYQPPGVCFWSVRSSARISSNRGCRLSRLTSWDWAIIRSGSKSVLVAGSIQSPSAVLQSCRRSNDCPRVPHPSNWSRNSARTWRDGASAHSTGSMEFCGLAATEL